VTGRGVRGFDDWRGQAAGKRGSEKWERDPTYQEVTAPVEGSVAEGQCVRTGLQLSEEEDEGEEGEEGGRVVERDERTALERLFD
jgi:hypothetical protein